MERPSVTYKTDHGDITLSPEIVLRYFVNGDSRPTDSEVDRFIRLCQYQSLNPYLNEAYLIKGRDIDKAAKTVVGKDVFTKRACKNSDYVGCEAGIWVFNQKSGLVQRIGSMVAPGEQLIGGWANVYRKNFEKPISMSVSLEEYATKDSFGKPTFNWRKMPATMIRKVALVQALREAFPDDFQGLYDESEMGQVVEDGSRTPSATPANSQESLKSDNTPLNSRDIRKGKIATIVDLIKGHGALLGEERIGQIKDSLHTTQTEDLDGLIQSLKDEIAVLMVGHEMAGENAIAPNEQPAKTKPQQASAEEQEPDMDAQSQEPVFVDDVPFGN